MAAHSGKIQGDGKLTFDRLTDVYHSGTRLRKISRAIFTSRTRISARRSVWWSTGILASIFVRHRIRKAKEANGGVKLKINAANSCTARPATLPTLPDLTG